MLNKIILMGRLTRDPELRHTQTGTAVASFSLAVDRDFKDKATGDRTTDFIDVVAWRQTGEFVSRYFTKGRMAEVVADNVYFGDSKRDAESAGPYSGGYSAPSGGRSPAPSGFGAPDMGDQFAELSDDDGELPF